jgi:Rrf2 family protein
MAMSRPTNTRFAIAVHVLTMLAGLPRELQSSEVMASSVGSSPVHIRRVLGRLRAAGLVASRPGPHGGWQLLRSPENTTLADVWRVMNGDDPILGVHDAAPNCAVGQQIQANLEDIDRRALAAVEAELATTTLAQLATVTEPTHPGVGPDRGH